MIKKIIITFFFLILIFWLAGIIVFAWKINHMEEPNLQKTDAIIALTGGRNRISEALKLFEKGLSHKMFISGVGKDISLNDIRQALHINLNKNKHIDIGHKASNTVENAIETHEWITKNNIKSIRLVTSNYHIARSLLEFQEYNPNLKIILHPVYSENIEKKWWTSWRTFSLIFKEYNKLLYVYCKNFLTNGD